MFVKRSTFAVKKIQNFGYVDDEGKKENQVAIIATLSFLEEPESHIVAACTHLKATKSEIGERIRERQIVQLYDAITASIGSDSSIKGIVVAGDMNAEPDGPFYTAGDV